ncbi:hypothetical protein ACFVYV_47655 [Streptomyces mirabilis]|uniref:hypothetical protein n=1 Tax=Streptomyces mirabilis TaxID=68239 RepID=UPI0036D7626D
MATVDPAWVSARRRQSEQEEVRLWHRKLDRELERLEQRRHKMGNRSAGIVERFKAEELKTRSLHDLIRRGLDPKKTRTFRGRVNVTVRCTPKGHVLARVYATRYLPVIVPQTPYRGFMHDKEKRFTGIDKDQEKVFRSIFSHVQFRDTWIDVVTDDEQVDDLIKYEKEVRGIDPLPRERLDEIRLDWTEYSIPNLTVIQEGHSAREVEYDGVTYEPSWYLLCRCGLRYLATYLVVDALRTETSKIFA